MLTCDVDLDVLQTGTVINVEFFNVGATDFPELSS